MSDWGDDYGNRVDRFLACIAYLDGKCPSLVMCRGYYTRSVLAAWNWRDGKLSHVWTFDTDDGTPGNRAFRGQGNHNLSVADVDGDGGDEIVYGSCVIDDNGKGLYSTGFGHGDAMHVTDIDPDHPGLEVFKANGDRPNPAGIQLRDARTGEQIWGLPSLGRGGVGRAVRRWTSIRGIADWKCGAAALQDFITRRGKRSPIRRRAHAIWASGGMATYSRVARRRVNQQVGLRKLRDERLFSAGDFGCASNNGSKSNPCLCADIFGDWREEIIARTRDNRELRIFTTTIPTKYRLTTLMHDPVYRLGVAWQNVSYNQPAHPGFYLGEGMTLPAVDAPKRPKDAAE